ncbi:MAG TPA: GNAT family N-acetyltransferase [Polyangiaceae bacterium]|nr:GNAT family N-acetyltransferase [Polyangiaceae bacterium]
MTLTIRPARPDELEPLLQLVRAFWQGEKLPYREDWVRPALSTLLAHPEYGHVLVAEAAAGSRELVAYLVLAFGYSLEHGGRDALVDELYVEPSLRGGGQGGRMLAAAEELCRAHGIKRLHLEVDNVNLRAAQLYTRIGFASNDRRLLTKQL